MIDKQDYIAELIHCLEADDLIKFRALAQCITAVDESAVKRVLYELSKSHSDLVVPALVLILSTGVIEGEAERKVHDALFSKLKISSDLKSSFTRLKNDTEKAILLKAVLELDSKTAVALIKPLLSSFNSQEDLMFVLEESAEIYGQGDVKFVEEFMYSGHTGLESVSLKIIASIDSDESAEILSKRLGSSQVIDRLVIESLARMNSEFALKKMVALLGSQSAECRNISRQLIARNGSHYSAEICRLLEKVDHEDFLILLLNVAGECGESVCIKPIRSVIQKGATDNVRFAAYEALGMLPVKAGAYTLTDGLLDDVEEVRYAAARAVNYNWNDMLSDGVKNLLRLEERADEIVDVLFNAEAEKAISALLDDGNFKEHGVALMNGDLIPSLKEKYMRFLKHHKRHDWLALLQEQKDHFEKRKVCAVDDSRMILSIYRKYLFAMDFEVVTFESGENALEYLASNKVDVLFTDLNMPGMTGIELTEQVREIYNSDQLPVIMVTTQTDSVDRSRSMEAGVNFYLNKPFDKEAVSEILRKELKLMA